MKTILVIVICICVCNFSFAVNTDLLRVRELYYKASSNKEDMELFSTFLASSPDVEKSLLSGYQGLCLMIKANYSWNPYNKLSFFNKGKNVLDAAIKNDPANMELRFLRFCVQTNAPGFLGYSGMITQDKTVIINAYAASKDQDLKSRIRNNLVSSKYCSEADKTLLNKSK